MSNQQRRKNHGKRITCPICAKKKATLGWELNNRFVGSAEIEAGEWSGDAFELEASVYLYQCRACEAAFAIDPGTVKSMEATS